MADVAVVILNYNGRHFLEQFLPSVIEHSAAAKIYVVDNASTDDSLSFMKNHYPDISLMIFEENFGYTGGYNRAMKRINEKYSVLLNSDIEVTPNWISPIVDFMENHPKVVACQPKILDFNQRDHFEYAGAAGGFIDKFGYPYCRGRIFDTLEKDVGQYDEKMKVFWATGACLFIETAKFHEVGGFDEDFFAHMEEIDLCWRLNNMGYEIYCIPASRIYHVGGGTLNKLNPRKTLLNFRNNLSMIFKNESMGKLFLRLPIRMLLDSLGALKLLTSNGFGHFLAVIKAYLGFLSLLPTNTRKRKASQNLVQNRDAAAQYNLLMQYFILGRKKYADLK